MNVYGHVVAVDQLLAATLLVPFIGAFLCGLTRERIRDILAVLFSGLTLLLGLLLAYSVPGLTEAPAYPRMDTSLLYISADTLSALLAVVTAGVAVFVTIYAAGYRPLQALNDQPAGNEHSSEEIVPQRDGSRQDWLMLGMAGALGVFLAGNLATMLIFLLVLAFAAWRLTVAVRTPAAAGAGRVFALAALGVAVTWLAGLGVMYAGSTAPGFEFSAISELPVVYAEVTVVLFGVAALICSAQLPFLGWIVKAASAEAPTNAFIHSAGVVVAGVYLIARIAIANPDFLGWIAPGTAVVGLVSMLIAMTMMLFAADLKQGLMLAVVTHLGMVLAALALGMSGSADALAGSVLQIITVAAGMALVFMSVGIAIRATGKRRIAQMSGLGRVVPYSALGYFVGAFVVAGLPPFVGFWGKLLVLSSGIRIGGFGTVLSVLILLESLVVFSYFLWLGHRLYFGEPPVGECEQADGSMKAAVVLLAAACVALPMFALPLLEQISFGM